MAAVAGRLLAVPRVAAYARCFQFEANRSLVTVGGFAMLTSVHLRKDSATWHSNKNTSLLNWYFLFLSRDEDFSFYTALSSIVYRNVPRIQA